MAVKKIAIFGATGKTGLTTMAQAVQAGYEVTVLVRDMSRLPLEGPRPAHVVVGDVLKAADVDKTVAGQEAVIILLGTGSDLSPTTVMSQGTQNIVAAMKAHGVDKTRRFWLTLPCVFPPTLTAFLLWDPAKVPPRLQEVTNDHIRMHKVLQESGLKYVAVMPPHIGDQPLTGAYTVTLDGRGPSRVISKHDLGHFMLRCLTTDEYNGHNTYPSHQYD
ncbi:flavin reductase (NADPH) isoform X1 [Perognathus longimembris pacificus]|uniref:flavin reductase (NADPH) isoform X1 n=1 Tax=Perognathus longimembris pacificus TaxID=214514 RepID=UPI002018D834|nr:flavin reductase (NADPH) isoform X1 [Perognathus longimembris pacificus]